MISNTELLKTLLLIAAILQCVVALLNLSLVRLMNWKEDLEKIPLLIREVFQVHAWFISFTVALFGVLTLRFAEPMARGSEEPLQWLAMGIGLFWGLRTVLQWTYYSASHWRNRMARTAIHLGLTVSYGSCAALYFCAGIGLFA